MALHVVRSLGQAFDVCHKQNPRQKKKKAVDKEKSEETSGAKEETPEEVKEPEPAELQDVPSNSGDTAPGPSDGGKETITSDSPPLISFDPFAPLAPPPPSELQIVGMSV